MIAFESDTHAQINTLAKNIRFYEEQAAWGCSPEERARIDGMKADLEALKAQIA